MKKEKAGLATGLKMLLLAVGLVGLSQPALANAIVADVAAAGEQLEKLQAPPCLGGVSLARFQPWRPAEAYRTDMFPGSYGPAVADYGEAHSTSRGDAGIDPVQTAAIIPGVFGSVALSMRNSPVSARWAPVYRAIAGCFANSACERKSAAFAEIVNAVKDRGFSDKLSFVNSSINRAIAYKKDSAVYSRLDYWAKPSEILERRAGDCEDFAILKMAALLRAGIPAQSMSLVVLQDRRKKFFHAVLSVSTDSGTFILDSLNNTVLKDSDLPDYLPLYSFSTDRAWIHGAKPGGAQIADMKGAFAKVAPGEGLEPDMSL